MGKLSKIKGKRIKNRVAVTVYLEIDRARMLAYLCEHKDRRPSGMVSFAIRSEYTKLPKADRERLEEEYGADFDRIYGD